jgi:mono/diheme cytochrome c family protein
MQRQGTRFWLSLVLWAVSIASGARALGEDGRQNTSSSSDTSTVWAGVYSEAQAERGRQLYLDTCSACHGQALEGADEAPALTGSTFTANWDGLSVGDLFERIRISMPQDQPGKLTREQYADVVAYLLHENKFPVGKGDLPAELPKLKQILIKTEKP